MMARKTKKKHTRSTKPSGMSKYAKKVQMRKRLCRQLGIPDTPLPLIKDILT